MRGQVRRLPQSQCCKNMAAYKHGGISTHIHFAPLSPTGDPLKDRTTMVLFFNKPYSGQVGTHSGGTHKAQKLVVKATPCDDLSDSTQQSHLCNASSVLVAQCNALDSKLLQRRSDRHAALHSPTLGTTTTTTIAINKNNK